MGTMGAWYYISKLNGQNIECSCTERNHEDYIHYKEAIELYKSILQEL